jgi:ferredoxin
MQKIKVDPVKCIGCGLCVSMAEEIFEMNDQGKSEVILNDSSESCCESCQECGGLEEKIQEVIKACPVEAISQNE